MRFRLVICVAVVSLLIAVVAVAVSAREQAYLGVRLQPLTIDIKEAMGLNRDLKGVLINDIIEDSPAEEAGLMKGDVIVKVDGEPVRTVARATRLIRDHSPGDEVEIEIVRDGKHKTLQATLGERQGETEGGCFGVPEIKRKIKAFMPEPHGYLGVKVEDISEELGEYFGVDEGEGVLVLEVMEDSPAEEVGLKPGDVILKIDGDKIGDREELIETIRDHDPGDKVKITYKRKRHTKTVEVELAKAPGPLGELRSIFGESRRHDRRSRWFPGRCYVRAYRLPEDVEEWIEIPGIEGMPEDIEINELDVKDLQQQIDELRDEIDQLREELGKIRE